MEPHRPCLPEPNHASLLVIGKTGAGKTTLINSFVNHFYKRQFHDERLVLIPQIQDQICSFPEYSHLADLREIDDVLIGKSRTDSIKSYLLQDENRSMLIIDTPGIGDTRGFDRDKLNIKAIIDGLKEHPHIQAILFVVEPNIKLDNIFKHYMDEIAKLLTEASSKQCMVVSAKNLNGVFTSEMKRAFSKAVGFDPSDENYFTINNKKLFEAPKDDEENECMVDAWEEASQTFEQIYKAASEYPPLPTEELTKLFYNRIRLEDKIQDLIDEVDKYKNLYESKLDDHMKNEIELEKIEDEIKIGIKQRIECKPLNYNCNECNETCIRDTDLFGYIAGSIITISIYHWVSEALTCKKCGHQNKDHIYENYRFSKGISKSEFAALKRQAEALAKGGSKKEVTEAFVNLCKDNIDKFVNEIAELASEIEKTAVIPVGYDKYLSYLDDSLEILGKNGSADTKEKMEKKKMLLEEKIRYEEIKKRINQARSDKKLLMMETLEHVEKIDKARYCPNDHNLKTHSLEGYICDSCKEMKSGLSYQCRPCDYDICIECMKALDS